jgi:hypothetical protein
MGLLIRSSALSLIAFTLFHFSAIQDHSSGGKAGFQWFGSWKDIQSTSDKEFLYTGFVNGYFMGDDSLKSKNLARCVDHDVTAEQAVAMIDKYSANNPERWNIPLGMGIIEALTVKDGPCPSLDPFK